MARSTDDIYDLLVALDKKVDTHIAVVSYRLDALEAKGAKRWQLWLALAGTTVGLPLSAVATALGLS